MMMKPVHMTRKLLLAASAMSGVMAYSSADAQTSPDASSDDIVVTASRLSSAGFTAPTPTTVVGSELLQARAAPNIATVLNELPSFRPTTSAQNRPAGGAPGGFSTADLRALGANRTLVLVDGRRMVPSANPGSGIVVDLNLIPTSLIKRAEVVTGGASAAWGSDAVAGVVNLLLDTKLTGLRMDGSFGITNEGDNAQYRLGAAFGGNFADDRGHILLGGEYVHADGTDIGLTRDWQQREVGLASYPASGRPAGQPARVYNPFTRSGINSPGGIILGVNADTNPANGADVLRGIAFGPGGTIVPFNYGTPIGSSVVGGNVSLGRSVFYISNRNTRYNLLGRVDYELSDDIGVFAEVGYGSSENWDYNQNRITDPANPIVIRRDNPYLPSQVASIMDANSIQSFQLGILSTDFYPDSGGFPRVYNRNQTVRATIGAQGSLGGSWKWDVYAQSGRNSYHQKFSKFSINSNFFKAVDAVRNGAGQIVCRVNLTTVVDPNCAPLNLFGLGSPSAAALNYILADMLYDQDYKQKVAAATLRGEPFKTWAGPVSIAIGGEYRNESISSTTDPISARSDFFFGNFQAFSSSLNVKEAFAEAGIPLARDLSFAHSLDLNGAIRVTDYSTSGNVTTWKIGATYEPVDWIKLRATRSRDIRAANLGELTGNSFNTLTIRNPFSGLSGPTRAVTSGNPALNPEIAKTTTIGLILSPPIIPGLRLSVDYFNIDLQGAIITTPGQQVVDNCANELRAGAAGPFCSQINYNFTGGATPSIVLNQITLLPVNAGSLRTKGFDFEAAYGFGLGGGRLDLRALATYTKHLIVQNFTSRIDYAGVIGPNGQGVPDWTGSVTANYSNGPWNGFLEMRYIKGGLIDPTLIGPEQSGYSPTLPNSVNINKYADRYYFNGSLSYDISEKINLYGTIDNIFNVDPAYPYTSPYHDRIGRTFRIGVRVKA